MFAVVVVEDLFNEETISYVGPFTQRMDAVVWQAEHEDPNGMTELEVVELLAPVDEEFAR